MLRVLLLACLLFSPLTMADTSTLKQWHSKSFEQVPKQYRQQPFLLVFWSLECPSCYTEFEALGEWKKQHPEANLVIVSTDPIEQSSDVIAVLNEYGLIQSDNWIFSTDAPAMIIKSVDPNWFGELPRSYFFNATHQSQAHSGALTNNHLNKWQLYLSANNKSSH